MNLHASFQQKNVEVNQFQWHAYKNADLKRKFHHLSKPGTAALPADKYKELLEAVSAMESTYAKVRVCDFHHPKNCTLQLEPEISAVLEKSRDPEELQYYWLQWYNKAGTPSRHHFDTYVRLVNEAALLNSE